jgi:hypothetical protein
MADNGGVNSAYTAFSNLKSEYDFVPLLLGNAPFFKELFNQFHE